MTTFWEGERGGLVVESPTPERGWGFDNYLRRVVSLSKDTFTSRKVLVIPRKRWLRPNLTEKLLTGMFSINTKKLLGRPVHSFNFVYL